MATQTDQEKKNAVLHNILFIIYQTNFQLSLFSFSCSFSKHTRRLSRVPCYPSIRLYLHFLYSKWFLLLHYIPNSSVKNRRFSSAVTPKPSVLVTQFHVSYVQATVYCSKKHGVQIRTRSGGHDSEDLSYVSYYNGPRGFALTDLRNLMCCIYGAALRSFKEWKLHTPVIKRKSPGWAGVDLNMSGA